ncbi:hypothetical protein GCM10025767_11060 [Thalassotalea piscium]
MRYKYPVLLACVFTSFANASDVENACFNCPPLDKVADAATFNSTNYYMDVLSAISNNYTKAEIKSAISTTISQNHKRLTYSEVWTALTKTDEDPNNSANVILLYRGISLPKMSNGSGSQSSNPDNWNREHVWAKSHGFSSSSLEAYSDIHHLRPTDISVNSSRGNLDFDNSDNALAESPENRVDGNSFEPRDLVKGDVARMIFYMDTRYEGLDNTPDLQVVDRLTTTGEPALGRLCRLIEWHNADPVDTTEQTRNDRIYEFQGNRNPFIDYPEWVDILYQADACSDDTGGGDTGGGDTGGGDTGGGDTGGGDTGGGDTGGGDTGGGDTGGGDTGGSNSALNVFISEYIEGSSYNKAIELFNPSLTDIDLTAGQYQLGRFSNGGTSGSMINLQGIIEAQSTFVISHKSAIDAIKSIANQEDNGINHNGDDAYVLYKNGEVIDSFGRVGEDPGKYWGADGHKTKDNSLVRKPDAVNGDIIIDDEFDPSTQWIGSSNNNVDNLGQHTVFKSEIFISEYIEGSGQNKAIELYNPSVVPLDLTSGNYQLSLFVNGRDYAQVTIDINGVIPAKGTFVIAHQDADQLITEVANQLSGSLTHNGDDAYLLYNNSVVIDSFGRVGEDPGSEWGSGLESTKDNTLVRKSSVTEGDIIGDDAFAPANEWVGFPKNTFTNLGSHDAGNGAPPVSLLGQCSDNATLISAVQGVSTQSPLVGETHVLEAVVSAVFPELQGFFIQEELAHQDNDVASSEAIFIYNNQNTVVPTAGDIIRVIGVVSEHYGKTQLVASEDILNCGVGNVVATQLNLPFSSAEQVESLEGMFITINNPLMVTDNYKLGQYGEVTLSNGRLFVPTNIYQPGTPEIAQLSAQNALKKITLDDGMNGSYPDNIIYPLGGLSAVNSLRIGDTVTALTGVIDYSFNNYRVIPTEQPTFLSSNPRTSSPDLANTGNLTVASFNVLNYFNGNGLGEGFPTDRGADTFEEFERQRAKIISAILAMDADIIGLLEMENDGFGQHSAVQDLVNGLNAVAPNDAHYRFVDPNIPADEVTGIAQLGGDLIKVAIIYNEKSVTEIGTAAYVTEFPFEYHNRPPMAQTFQSKATGESLTVAINHFRSKGCSSSGGVENEDKNDGQGCYNLRRVQAAQAIVAWLGQNPTGIDESKVLIMGDLNAYSKEDPLSTIEQAGYTNLTSLFTGDNNYTYTYQGESGTLDHALASAQLTEKIVDATQWHINADEPLILDYNTEKKSAGNLVNLYNNDAYRASDHDPVVVSINLTPASVKGDWDKDGDVDIDDINGLKNAISSRQAIDIAFDLNGDGVVSARDIRPMYALCTRNRCAAQ